MADVTSRVRLVVDSTGVDKAGRKLKNLRKGAKDADDAARVSLQREVLNYSSREWRQTYLWDDDSRAALLG